MDMDIGVKAQGGLFSPNVNASLMRTSERIEDDVAEHASLLIHTRLGRVLQNPTGRFESTIRAGRRLGDGFVPGEGTVYGRWLEGTSSRNQTTRFKGYRTFRIVGQQVEREAGTIADRRLDRWARSL